MASTSSSASNLVCLCSPTNPTSSSMAVVAGSTSAGVATSPVAGSTETSHSHRPLGFVAGSTATPSSYKAVTPTSVAGTTSSATSEGDVAGSTVLPSNVPAKIANGVKCKMCKLKPKFSFLRSQRSLDSGQGSVSPARVAASVKEAEAARAAPRPRRARSAERYDGLRVNESRLAPSILPRQTSLQTPMVTSLTLGHVVVPPPPAPVSSPPPSYDVVVGQAGLPPSYDEYLSLRSNEKRAVSPPPPWSLGNQAVATQTPQPAHTCTCEDCRNIVRQGQRAPQATPRQQLRVSLPPEATSSRECTCSRCMPRPNSYGDTANVNTAVLISLDTTAAMHGVLTDGIAFCSLM